jgi:hypothetical protein
MSDLLLPPRVQKEILRDKWGQQRAMQRAVVDRLIDFEDPVAREWAPVLAKLDPRLRLGRARPQAYEAGFNVKPGFYHWVLDEPSAPITVEPITAEDGESFTEPSSGLLRDLERNDLQNPHVYRALIEREQSKEQAAEKARQENLDEVNENAMERYVAATRAQVSMTDVPWSQNSAGRKGRSA